MKKRRWKPNPETRRLPYFGDVNQDSLTKSSRWQWCGTHNNLPYVDTVKRQGQSASWVFGTLKKNESRKKRNYV